MAEKIVNPKLATGVGPTMTRLLKRQSLDGDLNVIAAELQPSGHSVRIEVEYRDGTYTVTKVTVTAKDDAGLSSAVLGLPVKDAADKLLSAMWAWIGDDDQEYLGAEWSERKSEFMRRQRRRWLDDDFLRQVAEAYQQAEADKADSVIQAVADSFHGGYSTAQRWVAEARKRGHLPPTQRSTRKGGSHGQR